MITSAQPPIFAQHHYSHPTPPAPTASDSTTPWPSMPPYLYSTAPERPRTSLSPQTNENEGNNGLLFITGNKPADFKDKRAMTKVRKKAMASYLEKGRKPRQRARLHSEGSEESRTSIGSGQQDAVAAPRLSNSEALAIFRGESRRRKPSSPVRSPASSSHDQPLVPSPQNQIIRIPQSILEAAPMVRPMRVGVPLGFNTTSPRPFKSIGKPFDPFQTLFQANHPRISVEELKFHCSLFFGTRAMGQHWIPALVTSPHAFLSTLCIASAHHDAVHDRQLDSLESVALRQEVIYLINQNLSNPSSPVDDFNIIAVTQLMASEMIAGEDAALTYNEHGAEKMARQRGGLNQLGVNGRLASTLSWVSLEAAILRETRPRSMYSDFCASASSKSYPNTATIPESPLFYPRKDFVTIKKSTRCNKKTLELLHDIHDMMDFFLHETKTRRQNHPSLRNYYKSITKDYTPISELQKNSVLNPVDWTYEAVRITAEIQATAIIRRIPLSDALAHVAQSSSPSTLYTTNSASRSSESLISPTTLRHDSPLTSMSTSPSYVTVTTPSVPQADFSYFPLPPSSSTSKLSVSSTQSLDLSSYFSVPAPPPPSSPDALLRHLRTALNNSDLSDAWNDMAGVLLWIALVAGAASRKSDRVLKNWFSALTVRCSILLCFEHPEPIHATMLRMSEFMECVGYAKSEELIRRTSSATNGAGLAHAGKRRRF
ncbi:hypothetical protein EJ04DRAFT_195372 [Polyplosphaeria fusca]|uniref:Uncharacterized protein n=1 Tax=Polyplosphaeria fusca TaxID=682080 RepID=A0A9P4R294_9PLEO|nr:hypothetical protein EJ04DRAFT_195372 [Polyplosphaeria fusca]